MTDKIYDGGMLPEVTITPGLKFDFDKGKKVLFPKGYTPKQVSVIDALVSEANRQGIEFAAQLAYILATTYHECYNWNDTTSRMTQLIEMGGEAYLKAKKYYPFYGRGPNHLTWEENYRKEGKRIGLDLVKNPDLMLDVNIGSESSVYCMIHGSYRAGHTLAKYINPNKIDFKGARNIINAGGDKADLIAGYANEFLKCIW